VLALPVDQKLSLAVIAGPDAGRMFVIEKPRVVLGREDVDLALDDPEVSRQHAAIEVAGDRVTVVDLGSANGTHVGDEPVAEALLENQGEFTIGASTLMLIVTPQ
jgi:pSer/pThr/pTyr-binding forkhead associated (FHA) protein